MTSSTPAMKASSSEPPTMGTPAEACTAPRGKSPRVASVIEAAESAGMHAVGRAAMNGAAIAGMIK